MASQSAVDDLETDKSNIATIPIRSLAVADSPRLDGENTEHIRMLVESNGSFPPIVVHRRTMRVVDGVHRLRAATLRGADKIAVQFFEGDDEDAFLYAVRQNIAHGLPLSLADRTAAVERIIRSRPGWSDRAIADVSGLSAKTVGVIRRSATADVPQLHARVGRDGRVRPLDCSVGRRQAGELISERPDISLRAIAKAAGISLGTARDVRKRLRRGEDPVPARPRERDEERARTTVGRQEDADGEAAEPSPRPDLADVLANMRKDPSVRFNEGGRVLLRLLDMHEMPNDKWQQLADNVPPHLVHLVTDLAENCAQAWQDFAKELKKRQYASS